MQTSSALKQNPSKKANSSSPELADGTINVGKEQKGKIADSNQGHKVRSRTKKGSTPYPSPKGSRNHSPERSDPYENFQTGRLIETGRLVETYPNLGPYSTFDRDFLKHRQTGHLIE